MFELDALRREYAAFLRGPRVLLTGHSHQAWPDAARDAGARAFDDAARWVDDKWGEAVFPLVSRVGARALSRLGFPPTDPVTFGSNTHELVYRVLSSLRWSRRPRVVTTTSEFHSLHRQLCRLEEEGVEVVWVDATDRATLTDRLLDALTPGTAALAVSAVLFDDAWIVERLGELVSRAVEVGAVPLVDAYHAFNVTPLDLGPHASRAYVVAGGYKYAQLGEGVCFLRSPADSSLRPAYTGWFADYAALARPRAREVGYGDGGARFAGATFDATPFYRADAVLDVFDRHGLSVEVLRRTSTRQTSTLIEELLRHGVLPHRLELASSRDPARRAGFVALRSPRAGELCAGLRERGVLTDARGDLLRLGPAPYLTDDELRRGALALAELVG